MRNIITVDRSRVNLLEEINRKNLFSKEKIAWAVLEAILPLEFFLQIKSIERGKHKLYYLMIERIDSVIRQSKDFEDEQTLTLTRIGQYTFFDSNSVRIILDRLHSIKTKKRKVADMLSSFEVDINSFTMAKAKQILLGDTIYEQ